jgi:hypothetical protein
MSFEIYFYCDNSPNGLNYYEKVQDLRYNNGSKEENGRRNERVNAPIEQSVMQINLDTSLNHGNQAAEASG